MNTNHRATRRARRKAVLAHVRATSRAARARTRATRATSRDPRQPITVHMIARGIPPRFAQRYAPAVTRNATRIGVDTSTKTTTVIRRHRHRARRVPVTLYTPDTAETALVRYEPRNPQDAATYRAGIQAA